MNIDMPPKGPRISTGQCMTHNCHAQLHSMNEAPPHLSSPTWCLSNFVHYCVIR